jgi:hypothetical protein
MASSVFSGEFQPSLQMVLVRGHGSEKPGELRRQGVRPPCRRPHKRASGWSRCRSAVRLRNFSREMRDRGDPVKEARPALKVA